MAYEPTIMRKGGRSEVAETTLEFWQLRWEGWAADGAAPSTPPTSLSGVLDLVQGCVDHGSVSGSLTIDPAIGTHVLDATGALLLTLRTAANGAIVTVLATSGAANVTVDGLADAELTDGAFATFVRIRGAWVLASAGASTGTPDTTPPSAITGLVATGGEGQITGAWSAATDAESSVMYAYRAWLTSGGATGTYATTTSNSCTVTGLDPGDYTLQVYAYSTGGSTTPDSDTATVTGWATVASDDYTAANGTTLIGRSTPVGGLVYADIDTSSPVITIEGNRAVFAGASYGNRLRLALGSDNSAIRATFDYELFGAEPNAGTIAVGATVAWTPHASGVSLSQTGALTPWGSVPPTGLAGTLTGHPTSGTMQVEWSTGALVVRINGSEVATAALSDSALKGSAIDIAFSSRDVAIDNLVIETS